MELSIVKGSLEYLDDCKEALINSQLGNEYYSNEEIVDMILKDGINKEEIFVAIDENKQFKGYVWFTLNGVFYGFPYLRSIAVKSEFRGQGIGKKLINYFEDISFAHKPKIFMLVSDFNVLAKKLYQELGYKEVGVVPNLFKEGISEYIMMKSKLPQ